MPVRIDASGDYLRRTTVLDFQSPYTVAFWYSLAVNSGASYEAILTLSSGGASYDELFIDASNVLKLECSGNTPTTVAGKTLLVDRWYHIAVVRRSQSLMEVYVDGILDISNTASIAARSPATATNLSFGTNAFSEWTNARFAAAKAWQAALSRSEIIAEAGEFANVRQANIYAWWPMLPGARTVDWSGVGNPLSEGGTLTDEAGPLPASVPTWWLPVAVASAGGVTVIPAVASVVSSAVAPTTVLGAITLTPGVASAVSSAVAPTVVRGPITLTPSIASAVSSAVAPVTVLGAITLTPGVAMAVSSAVAPTILAGGITFTPAVASAVATAVAPSTVLGAITITPTAASAQATAVAPTVIAGSAIVPTPAASQTTAIAPVVVLGATTATPTAATVHATAIAPNVMITVIVSAILLHARNRHLDVTTRRAQTLTVDRDLDLKFRGG